MAKINRCSALDMLCQQALATDLSAVQLHEMAGMILSEVFPESKLTPERLVFQMEHLTSLEFAAGVKRSANGNATSTANNFRSRKNVPE